MTDFRALSAELLAALKVQLDDLRFSSELCRRAEAALAQPEPVKTPKPIRPDCFEFAMDFLGDPEEAELRNYIEALEAALAQPEPQRPTDEELIQLAIDTRLYRFQATAGDPIQYEMTEQQIHAFARAVLDRWGSPKVEPVPASEKPWERDGWCDAAGRCWFFWPEHVNDNLGDVPVIEPPIWEYRKPEAVELYPFSLPHDAVSLPNSNND